MRSCYHGALLALAVGRQTAGRVMPARWAMREADFEVLLRLVERLGGGERGGLRGALGAGSGGAGGGRRRRPRASPRRCGCWRGRSPPPRAARTAPRRGGSAGVTPAGCAATA